MIPVFAAAIGVMYNNKHIDDLVLSRKAVNDIFTGTVMSWDSPVIMAENPGKKWPNDAIVRVVRQDSSGNPFIVCLCVRERERECVYIYIYIYIYI